MEGFSYFNLLRQEEKAIDRSKDTIKNRDVVCFMYKYFRHRL